MATFVGLALALRPAPPAPRAAGIALVGGPAPAAPPPPSAPLLLRPEPMVAVGGALLALLIANRLVTDELFNSQSRADLIATVAPVLVILKALADYDITPREAEPVALNGVATRWVEPSLGAAARAELEWAADSLLQACEACAGLAIWRDGKTLLLRGTLPAACGEAPASAVVAGPLLTKLVAKASAAPDYLPALQLLPGRVEFSYLPADTQGVLMLPLAGGDGGSAASGGKGALVLACDRQRGFKPDDIAWARAVAARLGEVIDGAM